jgi:hypothetical protein
VGDLLHPSGRISEETYRLIGSAYAHIEACEPFVAGGQHLAEVAVVVAPSLGDNPGPAGIGAVRALQQLRQQFDVVPPDADLSGYRVVILPEGTRADGQLRAAELPGGRRSASTPTSPTVSSSAAASTGCSPGRCCGPADRLISRPRSSAGTAPWWSICSASCPRGRPRTWTWYTTRFRCWTSQCRYAPKAASFGRSPAVRPGTRTAIRGRLRLHSGDGE